jgi:hypothetical protein
VKHVIHGEPFADEDASVQLETWAAKLDQAIEVLQKLAADVRSHRTGGDQTDVADGQQPEEDTPGEGG